MAQTIKLKRSATQGAVPSTSSLALGELAINTYDGKIFIKKDDGSEAIVTIGELSDNSVTAAKIATGAVGASELASTGVTAGSYGSSSAIPVVTVDADGRVTSLTTASISGLSANSVTATEIATDAVGASEIAANSVGISELNVTDGVSGQVLKTDGAGNLSFGDGGGATSQSFNVNTATGDGSTTDFTLSTTPSSEAMIIAFIDGVFQNQDSYTFSGTTLSFDTAPGNGTTVTVYVVGSIYSGNSVVLDTFSGDGSTTAFTLSQNPQNENNTQIYIDGVYQQKSQYSVSGTTLTFSSAPPSGTSNIEVIAFSSTNFSVLNANSVTSASIAANAVGSSEIAANAVGSSEIAANAVGVSELASGALNGQTFTGDSEITGEFTANEFIGDLRGAQLFKAQAGENVTKGDAVYISGISGNTTVVSKADADDATKMPAFGIVAATTTSGQPVDIYTYGILSDLDTSSYSEGDELFVSTTAGALTDTAPTGETALLQKIAKVTRSNALSGSIFITGAGRTNAVPNLDEDQFFLGNASNQAVATDFSDAVESYLDGGTSTPTFASATVSGDLTVDTSTLYVDSTNNRVGIGTTSPAEELHLSAGSPVIRLEDTDGGYSEISGSNGNVRLRADDGNTQASSFINFEIDSTEEMRLTSTGLGIGTTSPSYKLEVAGDASFLGQDVLIDSQSGYKELRHTQTGENFAISSPESLYFIMDSNNDQTSRSIIFAHNNTAPASATELMRIGEDGNVGIGETSPDTILHIKKNQSSANSSIKLENSAGGDNSSFSIDWQLASSGTSAQIKANRSNSPGAGDTDLIFSTSTTGNTLVEAMRIDESQNVGIGTNSPNYSLDVGTIGRNSTGTLLITAGNSAENDYTQTSLLRLRGTSINPNQPNHNDNASVAEIRFLHNDLPGNASSGEITFYTNPSNNISSSLAERMRIDENGNVGINQTSPTQKLEVVGKIVATEGITTFAGDPTNYGLFRSGTSMQLKGASTMQIESGSSAHIVLYTNGGYERMRITSGGSILFGKTSASASATGIHINNDGVQISVVNFTTTNTAKVFNNNNATGSTYKIVYRQNNSEVGNISVGSSSTAYNTTSDYRLKENVDYDFNALERVAQLKPARFNFIADADTTVDGFLAHEVSDIVPEAITGTKDEMQEEEYEVTPAELDEDGNIVTEAVLGTREVPVYQGIDQSKLVPLLTKAIQEQQTLIEDLKSRIEALEG